MNSKKRAQQLHQIARDYVTKGLGAGDFESIPYHENAVLRAPIHPEGSGTEMSGKAFIKANWWAPLPDLVESTELIETYVNEDLSAVTVELRCNIKAPACTLRIIDRFRINNEGLITSQENFFDPRDITSPGWRS